MKGEVYNVVLRPATMCSFEVVGLTKGVELKISSFIVSDQNGQD